MSNLTPAVLATNGECRIALISDYAGKRWIPDGAWGSWNIASAFDASKVYDDFAAARTALVDLREERVRETEGRATFALNSESCLLITLTAPFGIIRRDGLAWADRVAEADRKKEEFLQPV